MRIAYLDCFAGISGDMFLGALLGAGVPRVVLEEAVSALKLDVSLEVKTVDRSGISATKVHVMEKGQLAEDAGGQSESATGIERKLQSAADTHSHQAETHRQDKPNHAHGRSLKVIQKLIEEAALAEPVKRTAHHVFELLGASEAKIHNVPVEEIHFHEVGALDAIVDIVAASAGIHYLHIGAWFSSPLNVGGGMVQCAHGLFPVPAPATADLLRGMPTYSAHIQKELVTPTGAALIRALEPTFGQQPAMTVDQIGYGAGTRDPKDFPNVLRLAIGEGSETRIDNDNGNEGGREAVTVLETALDDLSPQVLAYVAERALAQGALDVMLTPVVMKKGRPGTLVTVLCDPAKSLAMEALLLRETSTLGVRIRQDMRLCLERKHIAVETDYGPIRMKIGTLDSKELNAAPEFEDCKSAALKHDVALKQVQHAAIAAYRNGGTR